MAARSRNLPVVGQPPPDSANREDGADDVVPPRDADLETQGWERRFLAEPTRAQEAIELYTSMGFEVRAQKLTPQQFDTKCCDCPEEVCRVYSLIYTRKLPRP